MNQSLFWPASPKSGRKTDKPPVYRRKHWVWLGFAGVAILLALPLIEKNTEKTPSPSATISGTANQETGDPLAESVAPQTNLAKPSVQRTENALETPYVSPAHIIHEIAVIYGDKEGRLSNGELADIRQQLRLLQSLGPQAAPEIRQFLRQREDVEFDHQLETKFLGHASLRLALIHMLSQLGDAETAELAWAEVLHNTMAPMEIAAVSHYLQAIAADHYGPEILQVTKTALAVANESGLHGRDIGPLFQVVQQYSDAEVLAFLQDAPPLWWGRYSAIALANLPDGKGISALVKSAQSAPISKDLHSRFAFKLLVQAAANNRLATETLAQTVHNSAIPDRLWPEVAALAAGLLHYQINDPNLPPASGNIDSPHAVSRLVAYTPGGHQTTFKIRYPVTALSEEQFAQRLVLLEELTEQTTNPKAIQSLEQMHTVLTQAMLEKQDALLRENSQL